MAKQALEQIVQQFFDQVVSKGDLAALDVLVAEDLIDHEPRAAPGREGFKRGLLAVRAAFPDWTTTVGDIVVEGDKAAARWTARATHLGPFLGLAPTGRSIVMEEMGIMRIADGRIAEVWRIADELRLLQQLGLVPQLGSPFELAG
jgi:steroid delta-isomerase-like uncharacterized protein